MVNNIEFPSQEELVGKVAELRRGSVTEYRKTVGQIGEFQVQVLITSDPQEIMYSKYNEDMAAEAHMKQSNLKSKGFFVEK